MVEMRREKKRKEKTPPTRNRFIETSSYPVRGFQVEDAPKRGVASRSSPHYRCGVQHRDAPFR